MVSPEPLQYGSIGRVQIMAFDQLDAIEDVVEFKTENQEIWVVNHLIPQTILCRSERGDIENALVELPYQSCHSFRIAHDGGNHLRRRNCHEDGVDRLASRLRDITLRQRTGVPQNPTHQSTYSFS